MENLIESYASIKSFVPKEQAQNKDSKDDSPGPGDSNGFKSSNPEVDFHGQKRSNSTHVSTTDPEDGVFEVNRSLLPIGL